MLRSYPGERGLILITIAALGTAIVLIVSGDWLPALACIAGTIVGWWAVESANK